MFGYPVVGDLRIHCGRDPSLISDGIPYVFTTTSSYIDTVTVDSHLVYTIFWHKAPLLDIKKPPKSLDRIMKVSYNIHMQKKRALSSSRDPMQLSNATIMTLPDERYRSVLQARRLLEELCSPTLTPRVAAGIRDRARGALRHYPGEYDMKRAAQTSPDIFQERMEDLHRFVAAGVRQAAAEDHK